MLDALLQERSSFSWDHFYSDRERNTKKAPEADASGAEREKSYFCSLSIWRRTVCRMPPLR